MDGAAKGDKTDDWLLPEQSRPPLIGELERRVEEAVAIARASEAAIVSVGAAAIDAAEQARHAAELAERASIAAVGAQEHAVSLSVGALSGQVGTEEAATGEGSLSDFSARADRLVARLRRLQRVPLATPASDAAIRPQPAH